MTHTKHVVTSARFTFVEVISKKKKLFARSRKQIGSPILIIGQTRDRFASRKRANVCKSTRASKLFSLDSREGLSSRARSKRTSRRSRGPAISPRYHGDISTIGKTARAGVLEGGRGAESPSPAPPFPSRRSRAARAVIRDQVVRLSRFDQRQSARPAIRYGGTRVFYVTYKGNRF